MNLPSVSTLAKIQIIIIALLMLIAACDNDSDAEGDL